MSKGHVLCGKTLLHLSDVSVGTLWHTELQLHVYSFYIHRMLVAYQLSHYRNTFSTNWDWTMICSNDRLTIRLNTRSVETFELLYYKLCNIFSMYILPTRVINCNYIPEYYEFRNGYVCSSHLTVRSSQDHSIAGHWTRLDIIYNIMTQTAQ